MIDCLKEKLRFYFITDDCAPELSPIEQVRIVLQAGASIIQYRHKSFSSQFFEEVKAIQNLCRAYEVPLIINDNISLAKEIMAHGVHLGQKDEKPEIARNILGAEAIIGTSVSNLDELKKTDLSHCNYIGTGAVFPTHTKEGKQVCGLEGFQSVVKQSPVPVVAIGGVSSANAKFCFLHGASGAAVISFISRSLDPLKNAMEFGAACGCSPRKL